MAGYNSKFTGQQVDSLLEKAGSSYQKPETGIPQSDLAESTQQILQNVENKVNKEEGKGLSTNDFTDEYKAKVEDSASQEGYFPKMSVGIAANLAGRGEATEQVFTYRPTDGGTSIESGVAKIRRVKGNSVVWNQLVRFRDTWTEKGLTATNNGNEIHISGTVTEAFNYNTVQLTTDVSLKRDGRKYLVSIEAPIGVTYGISGYGLKNSSAFIWSQDTGENWNGAIAISVPLGETIDYKFKNPVIVDLTQMFGIGNEPTTVEEFRALYPDSYYPYKHGELRNLNCYGIKTVGFNQWDEQWKNGYIVSTTGQSSPSTNVICSKNFIPVVPNKTYYFKSPSSNHSHIYEYDKDFLFIGVIWSKGNNIFTTSPNSKYIKIAVGSTDAPFSTYNNDICINLHHTGWRDGEYEPYKEVTHSLPLSQITNGEPLRKAGSVYDEINETDYIKRVGVRPYTEGDKNDATLLTDGTNTNYPLAEPIVTPIETPLNLDYQVEDFGTEEALLTDNSAPFSADIVYQFNAVDRIRENTLDIADLLARVIALENAAATTTSIPDIPDITE